MKRTILVISIWILSIFLGYLWLRKPHKCPQPRLLSIIELQEAIGAKPDGIVGPETIGLWEEAYANQESAQFMTLSGRKK